MNRRCTTVATVLLAAAWGSAGCRGARPASPAPAVPPEAAPVQPAPPPPPPAVPWDPITMCVVKDGRMTTIYPGFVPSSGDTTVNGRPWREAYPLTDEYAAKAPWYIGNEPIVVAGHRYLKYGLPRTLGPDDVVPIGRYRGVTMFAEPGADRDHPEVVYLPVYQQCEFQPYQIGEIGGAVRG